MFTIVRAQWTGELQLTSGYRSTCTRELYMIGHVLTIFVTYMYTTNVNNCIQSYDIRCAHPSEHLTEHEIRPVASVIGEACVCASWTMLFRWEAWTARNPSSHSANGRLNKWLIQSVVVNVGILLKRIIQHMEILICKVYVDKVVIFWPRSIEWQALLNPCKSCNVSENTW